ncbi:unnamed protein product [Urochloa decumbens]|uniref:Uncharacterized protein n=1 Tax=Urochloa decumbens TaxID=240449 RepID=A0ABC9FSC1_9POAL
MSGCPSSIVYCDFGLCCGCGSDPNECPPPPPPPPPPSSYTGIITVVNAPMLPPHPPVPPYNQLPPPLPAPYLPPHAPVPPTMAYDDTPPLQTIPRQCVAFADKVYDSPLPVAQQPEPHKVPSKRYEAPALMGLVSTIQDPPPAPPALQHPLEPSRDSKPSMEYYSQEHHHQEYILTEGSYILN